MRMSRLATAGALCWALALPLFIAAGVVAGAAWRDPPYSWAADNISDLGNVTCGVWDGRRVCSPWHAAMNASILATGVLLAAGILLTWRAAGRGAVLRTGQALLLLAAGGYVLAGWYPADVDGHVHVLGALLVLGAGNAGLAVAGLARHGTALGTVRAFTLSVAGAGLAGAVLFAARRPVGLGLGGMERVAVFPFPLWAWCVGVDLIRCRAVAVARWVVARADRTDSIVDGGAARPVC